jgi:hypothetical protein
VFCNPFISQPAGARSHPETGMFDQPGSPNPFDPKAFRQSDSGGDENIGLIFFMEPVDYYECRKGV